MLLADAACSSFWTEEREDLRFSSAAELASARRATHSPPLLVAVETRACSLAP
jgi:hypothetical protein